MKLEEYKNLFKDHVITEVLNTDNIKVFDFRRSDGSVNLYQRWIIDRGALIVQGDCYSSIYRWNSTGISLEFLAKCNLDYFNEKCLADKDGQGQRVFDESKAKEYLKRIASDNILENCDDEFEGIKWEDMDYDKRFELVTPIIAMELDIDEYEVDSYFYSENPYDCYSILSSKDNEFMFGSNGWEYGSGIEQLTRVPKWHLAALKVAYEKFGDIF
jgi:hypothetical protein